MDLHTKFDISQNVFIIEPEIPARIVAIKYSGNKIEYCVEYWNNGEIRTCYQDEDQLQERNKNRI